MVVKKCDIVARVPEGRTLSYLKRTLNGRGGAKSHSVVCGNCELELMASAPNRPIDLLVSCPECRAINDLSIQTPVDKKAAAGR
jgi:phage FluMu protein Com